MSWVGYCSFCGPEIREIANRQMHAHSGPYFELWRRGMAASVGAVLPNDLDDDRESA